MAPYCLLCLAPCLPKTKLKGKGTLFKCLLMRFAKYACKYQKQCSCTNRQWLYFQDPGFVGWYLAGPLSPESRVCAKMPVHVPNARSASQHIARLRRRKFVCGWLKRMFAVNLLLPLT
jgi:hypothetical protein